MDLSAREARRIALAAQGFAQARPGRADRRHLRRAFHHVSLVQMDSVNVLVRSHYLPLFSRLGDYPAALLDELAYDPQRRELFEYWGHEASLIPLALRPLFHWRMARAQAGRGTWHGIARLGRERRAYVEAVLHEVAERGPLAAGELRAAGQRSAGWGWGWSDGKTALEWLFWAGFVTTAFRRGFERVYDLPERVFPQAILAAPAPAEADAQRELVRIAARACGIASERDLRDYFRLDLADARARISELCAAGELQHVRVEGWRAPGYLPAGTRIPRRVHARALLSPFDSLVWERDRAERLFGFRYRIGIYTPAHKREHGYYVLPFLLGDAPAARVDLKSDRASKTLLVQSVHVEPGADVRAVLGELAIELQALAHWLALPRMRVAARTPAADALRTLI